VLMLIKGFDSRQMEAYVAENVVARVFIGRQQFPEARKSQYSSGIPTCLFVNHHAKMGLS
jgi:hypothetical protein